MTEAADIRGATGVSLVDLPEDACAFLVPRGRFKVELFPTFMRLAGASASFVVQYKSITRVAYLPVPTSSAADYKTATRFAIVISLDDPLRQGGQRHAHLVLQLDKKEVEVELRIPEEDAKAGKYEGLGSDGARSLKGELPKVVGRLLKAIAGKAVYKPESFESANKQRAVRCNFKAQGGLLFPLEKSFIFIHKPTVVIRFADIETAEVQRFGADAGGGSTARTWDLLVKCRASGAGERAQEYQFVQIDRAEKALIVEFLKKRSPPVKVLEETGKRAGAGGKSYAEPDEDEDEEGDGDDDDDEDDEEYDASKDKAAAKASEEDEDDDEDDEASSGSGGGGGGGGGGKKKKAASKKSSSKKSKSKGKDSSKKRKGGGKDSGKGKKKAKKGSSEEDEEEEDDDDDDDDDGSD